MTSKPKLLIATSNTGKFEEIKHFFEYLPFEIVGLNDLSKNISEPEEIEETIESNAILKARYYAENTGMIVLADDGGIFIEALGGWPGVKSARVNKTDAERMETVLGKMIEQTNRKAIFKTALALYNPENKNLFVTTGETEGEITDKVVENGINNFGYNTIFFVPIMGKTYAEMSLQEKNSISHRGKALNKVKYYLQSQYSAKNIVVPVALIVKDGKIMSNLRNDPHRPKYHKKWEFPGGSVEIGESVKENLIREVKEETGYDIEIVKLLQGITVNYQSDMNYQVYLLPYACKIVGGNGKYSDNEVLEMKFFEIDDLLKQDLIDTNDTMYSAVLPELKNLIKENCF